MKPQLATTASAVALLGAAHLASATVLLSENFANFAPGDLVPQNGWQQLGANFTNPIQIVNGRAVVTAIPTGLPGTNHQDAWKNIGSDTIAVPSTLYLGLSLIVDSVPTPNSVAAPPYVFGVSTANNADGFINWRITFRQLEDGYQIGARVTGQSTSPYNYGGTKLNFGQEYLVVAKLEATGSAADLISVYIDPTTPDLSGDLPNFTSSIAGGTPPTGFGSVLISQFSTTAAGQAGWSLGRVVAGTTAASVIGEFNPGPNLVLGDFNFDGLLDAGDIDNFITALLESDPFEQFIADFGADFATQYGTTLTPGLVVSLGDFDGNDVFDAGDIDGFVDAVLNSGRPGIAVIPEPATLAPLAVVGLMLCRRRR